MLVRLGIFHQFRGANKTTCLKPPPRWCMKGFFKWCLLSSLPMLGLQPIWSILELLSFHNHGSVVVCHYFCLILNMASCENQVERLGGILFLEIWHFFSFGKMCFGFSQVWSLEAGQTDTGRTTRLVVATLARRVSFATAREMGMATMCTNHLENVGIIQLTWGKHHIVVCHVNFHVGDLRKKGKNDLARNFVYYESM